MSNYFSRYATSPGMSLVARYACKAESSNAYGCGIPERANTESSDSDVSKPDASLMLSAANPTLKPAVRVESAC